MLKIAIVDDHHLMRSGIISTLNALSNSELAILEFNNGHEICNAEIVSEIDVVILDINMPLMNGFDTCANLKLINSSIKVIFFTMYSDKNFIEKAFKHGANGYLIKSCSVNEIIECIETVQLDEFYITKELSHLNINQKSINAENNIQHLIDTLTIQEKKVMLMIKNKYSTIEIAEKLYVEPKSIDNYRNRICKKLGIDKKKNSLLIWVLDNKDFLEMYNTF